MKTCEFEGCDKRVLAKGLCRGHYNQRNLGKELTPLRQYNKVTLGKKVCTICGENKPVSEYYLRADGVTPDARCRRCFKKETMARWRSNQKNVDPESTQIKGEAA